MRRVPAEFVTRSGASPRTSPKANRVALTALQKLQRKLVKSGAMVRCGRASASRMPPATQGLGVGGKLAEAHLLPRADVR